MKFSSHSHSNDGFPLPASDGFPLPASDGFPLPAGDGFPLPPGDGFPLPAGDGFPVPIVVMALLFCVAPLTGCYQTDVRWDEPSVDLEEDEEDAVGDDDTAGDDDLEPGDDDDAVGDDDPAGDDDTAGDDDDSEDPPVPVEQLCDDGHDDDSDGLIDCEDPDCAGETSCSQPGALDMHTQLTFDANGTAKAFGVGDCTLEFAGVLSEIQTGNTCTTCDASYEGAVSYGPDNCPEDYLDRPPVVAYGVTFLGPGQREIWKRDSETGEWASLGSWGPSATGPYVVERQEPVFYDSFLGELEVGSFVMVQTFTDSF